MPAPGFIIGNGFLFFSTCEDRLARDFALSFGAHLIFQIIMSSLKPYNR